MILLVVNYSWELLNNIKNKYWNDFIIEFINENKWVVFWNKIVKLVYWKYSNCNIDLIVHFWTAGSNNPNLIWNIYKIDRTFLYYYDIIDNQRFRFWDYAFDWIINSNIVTKFFISKHSEKILNFAPIFDLESYYVAVLSNLISIPIISIKWITDNNNVFIEYDEKKEIEFLLYPNNKRKKRLLYEKSLSKSLSIINRKFLNFLENDLMIFYKNLTMFKEFKKKFISW